MTPHPMAASRTLQTGGLLWRDLPTLLKVRLTACRHHGHSYGLEDTYCENCGWPWFFKVVRRGA